MTSLVQIFRIDPRGLALLRMGLGFLVLLKLCHLFPHLGLLYTDDGLLPRWLLREEQAGVWAWISVYAWFGSTEWVVSVAMVHMAVALAFVLGWRTRWMTVLLWVLTLSLNARNPFITNAGDKLTVILLFWSMFLPLGRVWSMDGRRGAGASVAGSFLAAAGGAALILQIMTMYLMSGYAKVHPVWTIDFTAIEHALLIDSYSTAAGKQLLHYPELLKLATAGTLFLEQVFILLLIAPFWCNFFRTIIPLLFIGLHVGIGMGLNIGLFPWVCVVMWLALLPADFYDRAAAWLRGGKRAAAPREDETAPPRAVLVLCPGFNGNGRNLIRRPEWIDFAKTHDLGLVGLSFASPREAVHDGTGYYYASKGSGAILLDGIRRIYGTELPLILYGFSGGAHFTSRFVEWKPEAALTWAAYSAAWWDEPEPAQVAPPGLVACGDEDYQRYGPSLFYFKQGRAADKPWLWASLPGIGHRRTPELDQFVRAYFAALLASEEQTPVWVDVYSKNELSEGEARKHPALSGWLPCEAMLEQWQAVHEP